MGDPNFSERPRQVACPTMSATRLLLAQLLVTLLLACGCSSEERFELSLRRMPGDDPKVMIGLRALFDPPIKSAKAIHAEMGMVDGVATIDVKGWHALGDPGYVEGSGAYVPGQPFRVAILYKGKRDQYAVVIPVAGDPIVDPASGEFTTYAK